MNALLANRLEDAADAAGDAALAASLAGDRLEARRLRCLQDTLNAEARGLRSMLRKGAA
jgi:hypothetical protein